MEQGTLLSELPAMRILENEHRYLASLMDEWHAIVLDFQNDRYTVDRAKPQFDRLRKLLNDFKAPLRRHFHKEETYFFPRLGKHIGYDQGPIVSIEQEHEEIFAYIDHFLHYAGGEFSLEEMKALSRDAGEAFEILTVHFVKEETVLFPMTGQVMKPAEQEQLNKELYTLIVE
ncbi:hemerythrin domain-containing protein [Paenibacillus timonensis]|jgi:regulator of cell morphogenesis and NO signaling|uniref:Hemerythrin domain-containing protein n=1 Tax=Paenibacillus timonensis TaxID=225915 RepID=A0ABW3SB41_9BACL|nr:MULTISPECIES: hemerythrin domain-containing protein [Paenibacillus]MCH1640005.1 hemerythrin domain-containing protein [Paenibacillus timonensis]MDU2240548.1 hemerythrin domain-containing protein [Paenibacillus sp.]